MIRQGKAPVLTPPGLQYLVIFFTWAIFFEVAVRKLLLYFNQPSHELAEISRNFAFFSPFATFSIYQTQIMAFLTTIATVSIILRTRVETPFWRIALGVVLFFSLPVLILNGLLVPTHHAGASLWYYLSFISSLILTTVTFWLFNTGSLDFRRQVAWIAFILPALLIILSKTYIYNAGPGTKTGYQLFQIGTYIFIYQAILWPFLLLRDIKINPLTLLISFLVTFIIAIWFRFDHSAGIFFSLFRITIPLSFFARLMFFIALWSTIYTVGELFFSSHNRSIILAFSSLLWVVSGYTPWVEEEILPFVAVVLLLAIAIEKPELPPSKPLTFPEESWWKANISKHVVITKSKWLFLFNKLTIEFSGPDALPVKLIVKLGFKDRISSYLIITGMPPSGDPDWIATNNELVPVSRHLFSALPKVVTRGNENYMIWDRNFFTDEILTKDFKRFLTDNLTGEVRIWWGSGLVYESVLSPDSLENFSFIIKIIVKAGSKADI